MSTANQLYNRTVAKNTTLAKRHSHQKGYNHERLAIQAQEYGYDVNENGQLKYYVVGTVLNSSAEKEGQLTKDTAKVYLRNVDEEVEFRQKTNKRDPNQLRDTTARFLETVTSMVPCNALPSKTLKSWFLIIPVLNKSNCLLMPMAITTSY